MSDVAVRVWVVYLGGAALTWYHGRRIGVEAAPLIVGVLFWWVLLVVICGLEAQTRWWEWKYGAPGRNQGGTK